MSDTKTLLITGSTDGIGRVAGRRLAAEGHHVIWHGRSAKKLDAVRAEHPDGFEGYLADLSVPRDVDALAESVLAAHPRLDVLINNAGVYTASGRSASGLDLRFAVNTVAPYRLTMRLKERIPADGRIINLSSAAQAPVNLDALYGRRALGAHEAYAQSKLALTMWSRALGERWVDGPLVVSVNPGSMLATKMVKDAFGVDGADVSIGADILVDAALSDSFLGRRGQYFDNDAGRFAPPHPQALDDTRVAEVLRAVEELASA